MVERLAGRQLLVVICLLVAGCGPLDVRDHIHAYQARNRIRRGMTLPTAFDELARLRTTAEWPGLLAGFACDFGGEQGVWVLSRLGSGYVVITHPERAGLSAKGPGKQLQFPGPAGVHEFLSQGAIASCRSYQANVGRWTFGFSLAPGSGRVREVGPLVYHTGEYALPDDGAAEQADAADEAQGGTRTAS